MRMAVNAARGEKSSLKANVTHAQYEAALLGARAAAGAVRGKKESLEKKLEAAALGEKVRSFRNDPTFRAFVTDPDSGALEAAQKGHGGKLEDDFGKDLVRQTYQDGVLPQGDQERFRPKTADFMNEMKKRLKQDLAAKSPLVINNEIDAYKRRIAGMMYMAKVENDNQRKADRNEMLDEAKMTQAVNTLTASQAFNNLFNGANAYQMVQLAANGNLSTIFTRFANAGGQLQARRPQPVQPVLQQNQPVVDQIQQPAQI